MLEAKFHPVVFLFLSLCLFWGATPSCSVRAYSWQGLGDHLWWQGFNLGQLGAQVTLLTVLLLQKWIFCAGKFLRIICNFHTTPRCLRCWVYFVQVDSTESFHNCQASHLPLYDVTHLSSSGPDPGYHPFPFTPPPFLTPRCSQLSANLKSFQQASLWLDPTPEVLCVLTPIVSGHGHMCGWDSWALQVWLVTLSSTRQ